MSQEFWNERYHANELPYGIQPNRYLVRQSKLLQPDMRILAAGDGEGRNGIWLAQQDMQVWSADYSLMGLVKARKTAAMHHLNIRFLCVDLAEWVWPPNFFDVVVVIFVHFPPAVRIHVHRLMIDCVSPGGVLIMQAFHKDQMGYQSGGPRSEEMLYSARILSGDFSGHRLLNLEENVVDLQEGPFHSGKAAVVNLTIQKNAG